MPSSTARIPLENPKVRRLVGNIRPVHGPERHGAKSGMGNQMQERCGEFEEYSQSICGHYQSPPASGERGACVG